VTDESTRAAILALVLRDGPIAASELADRLDLASAGIRRHLGALQADGLIEDHATATAGRGRGRPARHYVATASAHGAFRSEATDVARDALGYLRRLAGPDAVQDFASQRAADLERRYGPAVRAAGPAIEDRVRALVAQLAGDGYAATARPGPGRLTIQICQGHCPVHEVARAFPEFCEAETEAIGRLLGVRVLRLATLATGEHVCTTCVPADGAPAAAPLQGAQPVKRTEPKRRTEPMQRTEPIQQGAR
jgi:predicted ArsR family transcriptional regulator